MVDEVLYIRKGEYLGEYYESKPFYSSVLTESEVAEIEQDVPDIRKRLIKVRVIGDMPKEIGE